MLSSGAVYAWLGDGSGVLFIPDGDGGYTSSMDSLLLLKKQRRRFEIHHGDGLVKTFDTQGRISGMADRFGNAITVIRNATGLPIALQDSLRRQLKFSHQADRITRIEDWTGRTWRYAYDSVGNLERMALPATQAQPKGWTTTYSYTRGADPRMRHTLTQIKDHDGNLALENTYGVTDETFNRVTRQTVGGTTYTYQYTYPNAAVSSDPKNRDIVSHRTTFVDGRGIAHGHDFNAWGKLLEERVHPLPGQSGSARWTVHMGYDEAGNLARIEQPRGNRVEMNYDLNNADPLRRGNLLKVRRVSADGGPALVTRYTYGAFNQPVSITYPDQTIYTVTLDAHGLPEKTERPAIGLHNGATGSSLTTYTYNRYGQNRVTLDPEGHKHEQLYYQSGPQNGLLKETRLDGVRQERYQYDALGRLVACHDAMGVKTQFVYNERDQLVQVNGPSKHTQRLTHDALGQLIQTALRHVDADGKTGSPAWITTDSTYDRRGRLVEEKRMLQPGLIASTRMAWDANDNLIRITDPEGLVIQYEYDERDRMRKKTLAPGMPEATVEHFDYDENDNQVRYRDPLRRLHETVFDGHDRLVIARDPTGAEEHSAWDAMSRLTSTRLVDARGKQRSETRLDYDAQGHLIQKRDRIFDPGGTPKGWITERYRYDGTGLLRTHIDHANQASTFEYDARGLLVVSRAPHGVVTRLTRDAAGRITKQVEERPSPLPSAPIFFLHTAAHDAQGRLQWEEDGLGNRQTYAYNSLNQLVRVVRPDGTREDYAYDLGGRLFRQSVPWTDGDGTRRGTLTTTYTYDRTDQLTAITDGRGHTTRLVYDALGRPRSIQRPDGTVLFVKRYDAAGNVIEQKDARGVVVKITYDRLDRPIRREVQKAGPAEGSRAESYTYDAYGHLKKARNEYHTVEAKFDSLGRVLTETVDGRKLRQSFGSNAMLKQATYPAGFVLGYQWDAHQRLQSLRAVKPGQGFPGGALPTRPLASFEMFGGSPYARLTQGNGLTTHYQHDAAGRLLTQEIRHGANQPVARIDMLPNSAGDIAHRVRHGVGSAAYQYDTQGQLTHVREGKTVPPPNLSGFLCSTDPANPAPAKTQRDLDALAAKLDPGTQAHRTARYTYDQAGNRTRIERREAGQTQQDAYVVDRANRYTQVGAEHLAYDAAGNLVQDATHTYHYDYLNRLVRVRYRASGTTLLTQTYDPLGRVTRVEHDGQTWLLSYQGLNLIEVRDGQAKLKQVYVHGPDLDAPLAFFENSRAYFVHQNPVGSVFAISDASGKMLERYHYDEFGRSLGVLDDQFAPRTNPATGNRLRFQGRPALTPPGLFDFRARAYDPDLGRFLQTDPLGLNGDSNLYRFAGNNPLTYADPLGMDRVQHRMGGPRLPMPAPQLFPPPPPSIIGQMLSALHSPVLMPLLLQDFRHRAYTPRPLSLATPNPLYFMTNPYFVPIQTSGTTGPSVLDRIGSAYSRFDRSVTSFMRPAFDALYTLVPGADYVHQMLWGRSYYDTSANTSILPLGDSRANRLEGVLGGALTLMTLGTAPMIQAGGRMTAQTAITQARKTSLMKRVAKEVAGLALIITMSLGMSAPAYNPAIQKLPPGALQYRTTQQRNRRAGRPPHRPLPSGGRGNVVRNRPRLRRSRSVVFSFVKWLYSNRLR